MTVELAEEHSTSNITSERLDAEQSERLRLGRIFVIENFPFLTAFFVHFNL